ncbi:hypothetical protein MJG53_000107 [Ovis ammon polii x Ovis aries]|nr:hypothetical protein MJG53_000107 [Ovis ammon polii x Ovis aries]
MRDTAATALEESASACPHSRRGLTPLGRLQKYPKIHVSTGEESSGSGPDSTQGLRARHRRERNPERPPRKSHGDWPFLRPPERVPEGPVRKHEDPIHIQRSPVSASKIEMRDILLLCPERIPGFPLSPQEEALSTGKARGTPASCHHSKSPPDVSVHSRGTCFPCTALTFKPRIDSNHVCTSFTPLLQLKKLPDIPVSTLEEARGSHPHPEEPRFRLEDRDEGHFAALSGTNSRLSPLTSRGGALHRKGERNSSVVPPFQESPRCLSPFQRNLFSLHCLDVQAEDRLQPRVHVGQPCGKASWESLVGKTRGKTIDPLIHVADCVTLLLPLWGKAQVHARIRDED